MSSEQVDDVVSQAGDDFSGRLRQCAWSVGVLLVVVLLVGLAVGFYGFSRHGNQGIVAAVVAGLLCFAAASAALIVAALTANTPNALTGILLGIVLRTAAPLLLSILLMQAFSPLADAGLLGMVLVNYLVVLTAETLLAVRLVNAHSSTVVQQ